jgi:hypothetical protein
VVFIEPFKANAVTVLQFSYTQKEVTFTLEQAMKAESGITGLALDFL